jgi:hypothetical protein
MPDGVAFFVKWEVQRPIVMDYQIGYNVPFLPRSLS